MSRVIKFIYFNTLKNVRCVIVENENFMYLMYDISSEY